MDWIISQLNVLFLDLNSHYSTNVGSAFLKERIQDSLVKTALHQFLTTDENLGPQAQQHFQYYTTYTLGLVSFTFARESILRIHSKVSGIFNYVVYNGEKAASGGFGSVYEVLGILSHNLINKELTFSSLKSVVMKQQRIHDKNSLNDVINEHQILKNFYPTKRITFHGDNAFFFMPKLNHTLLSTIDYPQNLSLLSFNLLWALKKFMMQVLFIMISNLLIFFSMKVVMRLK